MVLNDVASCPTSVSGSSSGTRRSSPAPSGDSSVATSWAVSVTRRSRRRLNRTPAVVASIASTTEAPPMTTSSSTSRRRMRLTSSVDSPDTTVYWPNGVCSDSALIRSRCPVAVTIVRGTCGWALICPISLGVSVIARSEGLSNTGTRCCPFAGQHRHPLHLRRLVAQRPAAEGAVLLAVAEALRDPSGVAVDDRSQLLVEAVEQERAQREEGGRADDGDEHDHQRHHADGDLRGQAARAPAGPAGQPEGRPVADGAGIRGGLGAGSGPGPRVGSGRSLGHGHRVTRGGP